MINRILCQVALSFLLGILLALSKSNWIIFIVFACVFNCCISRKDNYSKKKKVIFFGIRLILHITCSLLGYSRYEHQETKYQIFNARIENEKQITITGKIAKKEIKNDQIIYYLKNATTQIQNRLITCQEALIYDDTEQYPIGTNIQVEGDIRPFRRAANQGNFHEQNFYKSKNIWLALNADQIISLNPIKPTITEQLWQLKKKIHKVYAKHLPEEQAGVLSMMTIGEKSLLDPEIKSLYQRSGISHILAISGLHISLIGTGLFRILRKTGLPIPFACTIAIIFVYCFGIMSGMEVSTTRAVIMFLLQISAIAFRYSYDSITALSVSMVIQLFINPFGIVYAGFLFSYAAVLGVTTVVRVMEQFRHGNTKKGSGEKKLLRMVTSTLFVSLGIQFATLPLSIYFYYEFPVYSVLINAILLPLMGVLLPVGLIGGVLGIMRNGGLILVQIAGWMLEFNEFICNLFQQLPKAVYITGQPPMWILSSYYLLLLLILWIMDQLKETEQDRWKKSLIQMMPMLLLIGLIVYKRPDDFEVTFLDVGQGDGIHIATEEGKNFFIDGGSSNIIDRKSVV